MTETTTIPAPGAPVPFPVATSAELADLMRERHPEIRRNERLTVTGEIAHGHALVRLVLETDDETERVWIEVALETERNDLQNPIEARDIALDYAETILADFFDRERKLELLPAWDAHDLEGLIVKVRGGSSNPKLDAAADAFLAEHGFDENGSDA